MDEKMRKLYALQNMIEQQRGTGQISRADAARMSSEMSQRLGGLKRGSESDMYEYDNEDEYGVKTYGPETDSEYNKDRNDFNDLEELDIAGAEEESSRESEIERKWKTLNRE